MDEKDKSIGELKTNVQRLESRVESLETQIDSNSSYERRDTLILSGELPARTETENCSEIVRGLIREKIRLNLHEKDIAMAHRLGKKPLTQGPDKRSIVFKLCRRDLKKDIMTACREFRPPFYINESLTPTRSSIVYVIRKARQKFPGKLGNCRSVDGNICVWLPANPEAGPSSGRYNSTRFVINTRLKLDAFLMEKVGCDSSKFIDKWP